VDERPNEPVPDADPPRADGAGTDAADEPAEQNIARDPADQANEPPSAYVPV
jgi:hypothetical protein